MYLYEYTDVYNETVAAQMVIFSVHFKLDDIPKEKQIFINLPWPEWLKNMQEQNKTLPYHVANIDKQISQAKTSAD